MNNIVASSKFLDIAKFAKVVPIDKKANDKYDISNFRAISLFNCCGKVYKNIAKCRSVDSMYKNISLFISTHKKNCNKQYVMLRL